MKRDRHTIIFYDGQCGLCHKSVQFLLKHDKKRHFFFSPNDSSIAPSTKMEDALILVENYGQENEKISYAGEAVVRICGHLPFPYSLLGPLKHLPNWLLNPPYRLIAKIRNSLFSRPDCKIPRTSDKDRFLF